MAAAVVLIFWGYTLPLNTMEILIVSTAMGALALLSLIISGKDCLTEWQREQFLQYCDFCTVMGYIFLVLYIVNSYVL